MDSPFFIDRKGREREWTLDEKVGISGVSTYESRFKDIGGSFILKRKLVCQYKANFLLTKKLRNFVVLHSFNVSKHASHFLWTNPGLEFNWLPLKS